ncbi:hypothetical protein NEUTE1DRAFT_99958 [Neurospora tetrasperma FGSC 2508]|uniref:Uncharacterized protein n=1 Tax=Neurospora tetrasperma (strain FGSC 2508 / ATCC MYA-4615 / P0657) TaxID=510951 RepID=F8MIK5_NEUT8|nr:uncharacterized protein NEUTE1DRAFT_99958 [Neurospora tetrasperma FGSC 2508]EGO59806.1 hypothetical protein NEUTE1DRAFT_99958 [Neurospora tetrasperma FGSC 2508]
MEKLRDRELEVSPKPRHPADYKKHWKEAESATFQIVRIEDMSVSDVMRFVLNSAGHYCWQDAFLSSELESIYRHSHVVHTLLTTGWQNPNDQCTICFKELRDRIFRTTHVTCGQCGRAAHKVCVGAVKRVRQPIQDDQCYICEDRAEWGVEKYSEQRKARPAVPVNTTVTPAVSQPAKKVGQHSFQTFISHCSSSDVSSISSLSDLSYLSQLFGKKEASYSPHYQQPKCQPTSHKTDGQQVSIESRSWPPPSVPSTQPIRPKTANVRMSAPVPQSHTPVPLPAIAFALFLPTDLSLQPNSPVSIRVKPIIEDEARYTPSISDKPADSVDRQLSTINSKPADISANASSPAAPSITSQSPTSGARPAAGSFADNGTATASKSPSTIRTRIQNHQRKVGELKQIFERLAKESKQGESYRRKLKRSPDILRRVLLSDPLWD